MIGEMRPGAITLLTTPLQITPWLPTWAIPTPTRPPTRACEEEEGRPKYHVIIFQIMAPISAARMSDCLFVASPTTIPLVIVLATPVKRKAPIKLKTAAIVTALPGERERVETDVAIALAAS